MQVKSIDFLLTLKCPSKCKHCSYRAGPERTGFMSLRDAERWLTELLNTQPLKSFTVHGGEPFLYFEVLKGIFRKVKELGVQERWVITNGYWAKDFKIAKEYLNELKEAGLLGITFSVDAFHQEYIPLETVRTGIEAAVQIGFEKVAVDSYFLGCEDSDNEYDISTENAISGLKGLSDVQFSRFKATFEGRAAELIADDTEIENKVPTGKCQFPFWLGGDLKNPEGIEIDFEGNVTLCPGISIGNAKSESSVDILKGYDYRNHPIIKILAEEGPIGLMDLAREKGYEREQKYINECHLCYEMRKFLYQYYSHYLKPVSCYSG